jgi:hypothetical protein
MGNDFHGLIVSFQSLAWKSDAWPRPAPVVLAAGAISSAERVKENLSEQGIFQGYIETILRSLPVLPKRRYHPKATARTCWQKSWPKFAQPFLYHETGLKGIKIL